MNLGITLFLRSLAFFWLILAALNAAAVTRHVDLNSPSPTPPYTNWLTAATNIQDAIDEAVNGDRILVTNGVYGTGGRVVYYLTNRVAVTKPVTVESVNGPAVTLIEGYHGANLVGRTAVRCVYLTNGAVLSGFTLTNGGTSDLVTGDQLRDGSGGGLWCETNGTVVVSNCVLINNLAAYYGGGVYGGSNLLYDCSILTNKASMGAGAYGTMILNNCLIASNRANGAGGGAYLSTLNNCELIANQTASSGNGGGAYQSALTDCLLLGNSAFRGAGAYQSTLYSCKLIANQSGNGGGGGAYQSTLTNCLLVGNSATGGGGAIGGGAFNSTLWNCTVISNSATAGGGVYSTTGYNSIIYYNSAATFSNYVQPILIGCCTVPGPTTGGNITNEPAFVDLTVGDLRLQSNSPCINAGNNGYVTTITDLESNPRIVSGTVDIGAYEFQTPSSVLSYAWAQQFGLSTDGSADSTDNDGDGHNNWQEWRADTIPTNALSVLRMMTASNTASGLDVTWQSVSTRSYFLDRATNFSDAPPFQTIATNIAGASGTKTYTDTSATNSGPYFYRVGVQ